MRAGSGDQRGMRVGVQFLGAWLVVVGCAEVELGSEDDDPSDDGSSADAGGGADGGGASDGGGSSSAGGRGNGRRGEDPPAARRVFVTSDSYAGDLGGLAGADSLCQDTATRAGLSGEWRAWLGTHSVSASDRLAHSAVPYVRLDGVAIAADWADVIDGALDAPIMIDEMGSPIGEESSFVWTATGPAGLPLGGTCNDWTEAVSGGFYGDALAADDAWTHSACQPCTIEAHLYCFEQ